MKSVRSDCPVCAMEWVIVSTNDGRHLEDGDGGEEGFEEADLIEWGEAHSCAQSLTPGVSVAQVARGYSMNANLIFKWQKDPRFVHDEGGSSPEESIALGGVFLPVEIETPALEIHSAPARMSAVAAELGPAALDIAQSEVTT